LHLDAETALSDYLSIVFAALLPGLNPVPTIDVHLRNSVEAHDAFDVAGVKAFRELAGHMTKLRDMFRFGLDRWHGAPLPSNA
jgi:hypothetical protein